MSHWAEVDEDNKVLRVLVGDNNDPNGDEGYEWFVTNLGGRWIQTSYNGKFRKQFAGVGFVYDPQKDIFIAPQPFPSWSLDENFDWQPPKSRPHGFGWAWDEEAKDWVNVEANA